MADREDFKRQIGRIQAVPDEKAKGPGIPVMALSKESEMLFDWVQEDKQKFIQTKFDWDTITILPQLIGAARYAEAVWRNKRLRQEDAQKEWEAIREKGDDIREDLFAAMDLAFDEEEDLLQRLAELKEGESNADMISDIVALVELGREHRELMDAIGFDPALINGAAKVADKMASLLGEADAKRLKDSEEKKIRDKAYTLLTNTVRKIRKCGKYVNRKDPERLKGYTSQYIRSANRKHRNKVAALESVPEKAV